MGKRKSRKVESNDYIMIHDWMIRDIKLKSNELLIYAIIYSFSRVEGQTYFGGLSYLASMTNTTERSVRNTIKALVDKGLVEKHDRIGSLSELKAVRPTPENISAPTPEKNSAPTPENFSLEPRKRFPTTPENFSSTPLYQTDHITDYQSFSQDANSTFNNNSTVETVEPDRQTDGSQPKRKYTRKYNAMLQMISSPLADTHMTSEKSLADFDEDARGANQCTLPYEIQREPEQLRAALHYLIAYSNRIIKEEENVRYFTDTVIDCITELVYYGKCGNRVVSYPLILDKLNEIIHQSSLADWMYEFYEYWMEQIAERDIHHKKAYLRSCTYSYLQEYKIKNVYADWMAS